MKIKWKSGNTLPKKNGYYICWNPDEDSYPTVCYFSWLNETTGWWTYSIHKIVLGEIAANVHYEFIIFFRDAVAKKLNLTAEQKKIMDKITDENTCSDFFKDIDIETLGFEDGAHNIKSFADQIYDVGTPQYWAELPYLFDTNFWEIDSIDQFDVEIEDAKANAISLIAEQVESLIAANMAKIMTSPYEKHDAPWVVKKEEKKQ